MNDKCFYPIKSGAIQFTRGMTNKSFPERIPNEILNQLVKNFCIIDCPGYSRPPVNVITNEEYSSCIEEIKQMLLVQYLNIVNSIGDNEVVINDYTIILRLIDYVQYNTSDIPPLRYLRNWINIVLGEYLRHAFTSTCDCPLEYDLNGDHPDSNGKLNINKGEAK